MSSEPVVLEVDSRAAATAYAAFVQWAGQDDIVVFFEPETIMAVDRPDRRGFLYDETYFVTLWSSAGGDELVEAVRRRTEDFVLKDPAEEPLAEQTLALVLAHGAPIDEVRHLI